MKQIRMHGVIVKYEDDAHEGVNYILKELDHDEAKVFIDEARRRGEAQFEDRNGKNYTLSKNSDGTFDLVKRPGGGSSFF
ncbi:MAG: hypothetical protein NTW46_01760 [Candidatus Nealsonbacteria bacterium]|nr:hypothetical protein [Candidatus Nealsonbacteria bacterium]